MTTTSDEMIFAQLAAVKHRLETFPWSNHEAKCLRDCLLIVIRSIVGEVIEREERPGSNIPPGDSITVGNQRLYGGVEVAPGVVVYAPGGTQVVAPVSDDRGGALMDIAAGLPYHPQTNPRGIKPVPGSLMARALGIPDEPAEVTVNSQPNGGK